MITTVTGKNQITIPAAVVKQARIRQGSQLEWRFDTDKHELHIKILPSRGELGRQIMGSGRQHLKPGDDPIADLLREREQDDAAVDQTLNQP